MGFKDYLKRCQKRVSLMTFLQKKTLSSSSSFSPFGFLERLKRSKRREEGGGRRYLIRKRLGSTRE